MLATAYLKYHCCHLCLSFIWHFLFIVIRAPCTRARTHTHTHTHTHTPTRAYTHTRSLFFFSLYFGLLCLLPLTSSIVGIACHAWNSSGTFFHNDMQAHTHTNTHTHTCSFFFFIYWCVVLAATYLKYRLSCLPFICTFFHYDMQAHTYTHACVHTRSFFFFHYFCCVVLAATSSIAGIACRAWNSSGTFFHNDMQAHTHTHTYSFFSLFIGVWCLLLLT